jgi:hypothetical protein
MYPKRTKAEFLFSSMVTKAPFLPSSTPVDARIYLA